jgi:hypothetical protein
LGILISEAPRKVDCDVAYIADTEEIRGARKVREGCGVAEPDCRQKPFVRAFLLAIGWTVGRTVGRSVRDLAAEKGSGIAVTRFC